MKWLAAYALLVAVPVGALAAILNAGSRLRAPIEVAGEWRLDAPGFPAVRIGSGGSGESAEATEPGPRVLTIAQSGVHLSLAIGPEALPARLSGDSVMAERHDQFTPVSTCYRGRVVLRARVDTAARPLRMAGTIGGRSGCPELPFTAVRTRRR